MKQVYRHMARWVWAVFAISTISLAATDHPVAPVDCNQCHSCPLPTKEMPCLKMCPRDKSTPTQVPGAADDAPATILIKYMDSIYQPVIYDHKLHAEMPDAGCQSCHHHSSQAPYPACQSCHPVSGSDAETGVINLRGAFHRQCLSCHRELSSESSCGVCHQVKTDGGTTSETPVAVPSASYTHFDHSKTRFPLKSYHQSVACINCHRKAANHRSIPTACSECHAAWPDDFRHEVTGLKLDEMHASLQCNECHDRADTSKPPSCTACHDAAFIQQGKLPGTRQLPQ